MMTSAQVVETSVNVTSNSPSQDYTHPDDRNLPNYNILLLTIANNIRSYLPRVSLVPLGNPTLESFWINFAIWGSSTRLTKS